MTEPAAIFSAASRTGGPSGVAPRAAGQRGQRRRLIPTEAAEAVREGVVEPGHQVERLLGAVRRRAEQLGELDTEHHRTSAETAGNQCISASGAVVPGSSR